MLSSEHINTETMVKSKYIVNKCKNENKLKG